MNGVGVEAEITAPPGGGAVQQWTDAAVETLTP